MLIQSSSGDLTLNTRWLNIFGHRSSCAIHILASEIRFVECYTFKAPFVPFTKSLNCSSPLNVTSAPFSSSYLAMNAVLTPSNHLVQDFLSPFDSIYQTRALFWSTALHSNASYVSTTSKLFSSLLLIFNSTLTLHVSF